MSDQAVERRVLRFASIRDLEQELEQIESAHREGRLTTTGNWSPGQNLNHLGAWIEYGFEGYPQALSPPPAPLRLLLRLTRGRFLSRPLPVGFRIPKAPGGTFGTEETPFEEGLSRLRRNLARLKAGEAPVHPSPAFGLLTNFEAVQLTLRHAELHLGFLKH
jgi:hypothetical protein